VKQEKLNELALFAGAGGGILGGHLLGWRTVCAVEWEPYPASVLVARQNDKILPPFPIWDDVQTFDGKPWRGIVDVVSGGFPCQDISSAGKGAGIEGERSGMWKHMARIIGEVRPKYVFVENSPMLTIRGLGVVLADLSTLGFNAKWGVVSAADVGANHKRERIWIRAKANVANAEGIRNRRVTRKFQAQNERQAPKRQEKWIWQSNNASKSNGKMADTNITQCERNKCAERIIEERADIGQPSWWQTEPSVGRVANGMADRVDRLKAIGNGQVPLCAATAWRLLNAP
jgi:DNA (cytosine-5)-methyltransferase 1